MHQQLWHLVRAGLSLWVDSSSVVCSSETSFSSLARPELVSSEPCRGLTLGDDGSAVRISESSCVQIIVSCETNSQNTFHLQECWQKEISRLVFFLFSSIFDGCPLILKTWSFWGGEHLTTTENTDRPVSFSHEWHHSEFFMFPKIKSEGVWNSPLLISCYRNSPLLLSCPSTIVILSTHKCGFLCVSSCVYNVAGCNPPLINTSWLVAKARH